MKKSLIGVASCVIVCAAASANAAMLAHRYTFDAGTGNDSVGTSNGTLVNGATISGGQLVTTSAGSGVANGLGVSLPSTAVSGLSGDFTVEQWFTRADTTSNYQVLSSFDQETTDTNNYLLTQVERGDGSTDSSSATEVSGTANVLKGNPILDTNQHQIVTTYVASTSTLSIYNDGTMVASQVIPAFNLSAQTAFIGINTGSPYPDPSFNGSTNEFSIYNGALSSSQISSLYGLGADPSNAQINALLPEPSGLAFIGLGAALAIRRRRKVQA